MKNFAIWFISCFTCAFAANHNLVLEFNEPVEIRSALSEYKVVSFRAMEDRPVVERSIRMKNGQVGTQLMKKPGFTYQVTIESDLQTSDLLDQLHSVVQFTTGEPNHPGSLTELDAASNVDARLQGLVDDIDARIDGVMDTFTGSAPQIYGQYHTWMVRAVDAWDGSTGSQVIVAVLDTGIDLDHPFFAGSLVQGYDYVDYDWTPEEERSNIDTSGNGIIDEGWGHGTHVAGIVKSVAPYVKIMPIRVCDSDGQTDSVTIANAIAFAINHGAQVINMSMSIFDSTQIMRDYLYYAYLYDIPVITSAGNHNSSVMQFPATEPQVMTVASVNEYGQKSSFSNFSTSVTLSAPGENIYGPAPGGMYCARSGTSMSAPIVAAQAAIILQLVPTGTVTYIKSRFAKAYPINSLNPGYAGYLGYGLSDIYDSITVADQNLYQ